MDGRDDMVLEGPRLAKAVDAGAGTAGDLFRLGHLPAFRTDGAPGAVRSRRARQWSAEAAILLVLDGSLLAEAHAGWLDSVPAASIRMIRVLSPEEGFLRYGYLGRHGAVLIRTLP